MSKANSEKTENGINDKVRDIIGGTFGDPYEHAHAYLNLLDSISEKKQTTVVEIILSNHKSEEFPKSGKRYNVTGLSEEAKERLQPGLGSLIDGNLKYILVKRPSAKELAEYIWNVVNGLETEEEKIFALGWVLIDNIVPYIQIPQGGVRMDQIAYRALIAQQNDRLKLIGAVLRWPGLQRTEQMSLVLGVIMDGTTIEEQAVLLSKVVVDLENSATNNIMLQLRQAGIKI